MKALSLLILSTAASITLSSVSLAADTSSLDHAFAEADAGSYRGPMAGSGEMVGAMGASMLASEHSMKLLNEQDALDEFEHRARADIAAQSPQARELLEKKARLERLEVYQKKGAGLKADDLAEQAAIKKELALRAPELKAVEKLVEADRQALMSAEKIWTPKGEIHPDLHHKGVIRKLQLQRAGLIGAAALMAADGGRRMIEALTSSRSGYAPSIVSGPAGTAPKTAPAAAPAAEVASTTMSVE